MSWYENLVGGVANIPRQGVDLYKIYQGQSPDDSGLLMHQKKKKIADHENSLLCKGIGLVCGVGGGVLVQRAYKHRSIEKTIVAGTLIFTAYELIQVGVGLEEKADQKGRFQGKSSDRDETKASQQQDANLVCKDTLLVRYAVDPIFKSLG